MSPFAIQETLNSVSAKPDASNILNNATKLVATHLNVWYFKSACGRLSQQVAAFPMCDKGNTRQFDFMLQFVEVTAKLGVWGIHTSLHTADSHQNNVVSRNAGIASRSTRYD